MAGFIVLNDGRAYAAANWAFRGTIEAVVEVLPETDAGTALQEWLTHDTVVTVYHSVDVRELTPPNQVMFLTAVGEAFNVQSARGPIGWPQPEFWDGWIKGFADLVKMIECVRRGEPADNFNPHMTSTLPPTGERNGPGC